MTQRQAVARQVAIRCRLASKGAKVVILGKLCSTKGWHHDYSRKALRNPTKRLDKEIRRRTDSIRICPIREVIVRLVGTILAE